MGLKSAIRKYKGALEDIQDKRIKAAEKRAKADVERAKTKGDRARAKERLKQEKLAIEKEVVEAKIATQKAAQAVAKAQKEAKDIGVRRGGIQGRIADFGEDLQRAGNVLFREISGQPVRKRKTTKRKTSRRASSRSSPHTSVGRMRR